MYIIIGGDGREYGPVSADELRQWIAEGRLDRQSWVKSENDAEFRPLAAFPEFADAFGGTPAPPVLPVHSAHAAATSREMALQRVRIPAVGLMVMAILDIVLLVYALAAEIFFPPTLPQLMQKMQPLIKFLGINPSQVEASLRQSYPLFGRIEIISVLFQLVLSVLILRGATKMRSLRSYQFAVTVSIISLIPGFTPCAGYVLGLIFGFWALGVLRQPGVKSHFH